jgi:hypothetical protein
MLSMAYINGKAKQNHPVGWDAASANSGLQKWRNQLNSAFIFLKLILAEKLAVTTTSSHFVVAKRSSQT